MTSPADLLRLIEEIETSGISDLHTNGNVLSEASQQVFAGTPLHAFTSAGWSVADTVASAEFWRIGAEIATVLALRDKQPHLLVNGRVSSVPDDALLTTNSW